MPAERTLLLIADIGGYTRYMRTHRMSLAHAEVNTTRLLEAIIDAAGDFELIEIEGDAAFLARRADELDDDATAVALTRALADMHAAFHRERAYVVSNLCPCASCEEASAMTLKFVAHVGDVATQTIRDRRKLVGIDVILVHRLLKNGVQDPEYVLLSEQLYGVHRSSFDPVRELEQELEGIGPALTYVAGLEQLAGSPPALPKATALERLGRTLDVAGRGLPFMFGRRRTRVAAAAA